MGDAHSMPHSYSMAGLMLQCCIVVIIMNKCNNCDRSDIIYMIVVLVKPFQTYYRVDELRVLMHDTVVAKSY